MSKSIQLLVLDVDGVLTDGRLLMVENAGLIKAFHVLDGGAIRLWRESGRDVAILTARRSPAVAQRANELGIEHVLQGFDDKLSGYERLCRELGASDESICYVGDDFLDLRPMQRCGYPVAVASAAPEVKRVAAYVTGRSGGAGAVREVVQHLLSRAGQWNDLVDKYRLAPIAGKG
ncbi:MAG: HAD hydrolase family protein [Phycisphaerae bacterium]|nr:HAD hydrolase family protein [Phycisphaerae bacterium]